MDSIGQCPNCGGELQRKRVQKILRGGVDTASIEVDAEVCTRCGERLYSRQTIERFQQIRTRLTQHDTQDFVPVGTAYQVS